jgi:hypothetical protein
MSEISPIDEGTLARLRDRAAARPLPQVLVLPSQVRDGIGYYSELDVDAVKIARDAGVDAEFLDDRADRRFLSEYSADVIVAFAIAVAQQLTVDGVIAIGRYLLARLGTLSRRGLTHAIEETRVRVDIDQVEVRTPSAEITVKGLRFEASGRHAVTEVVRGLTDGPTAEEAIRELGLAESDEPQ